MKKLFWTSLLAGTLLLTPAVAQANSVVLPIFFIGSVFLRPNCQDYGIGGCGGCAGMAGPWYSYWPYEAHFQTPAHSCFPYWPSPMGPGNLGAGVCPAPNAYQPVGYYSTPPSYWYGR